MKKVFLSYSWSDDPLADEIEAELKQNTQIELHRDKIDLNQWDGIREYMQSIPEMDYVILLISDAYLKSVNCMYEVLEVMRDRKYRDKIFPAVVATGIYNAGIRAQYVIYWQTEYKKLNASLEGIATENIGNLGKDLKRLRDISSNVAEFLDMVAGMNNPAIKDVCKAIAYKLSEKEASIVHKVPESDLFSKLGLLSAAHVAQPTEYEINQFMRAEFDNITNIFSKLCMELQNKSMDYQATSERIDSRTVFYQFYKSGKIIRDVKIFLGNMGTLRIGVSVDNMYIGNNSWNEAYEHTIKDGKLYLKTTFSFYADKQEMSVEDVVADIWKRFVEPYLR